MAPALDRQQFRAALATLASKTLTKIPALNGRVEKACKLVLQGDVELHDDHTALVNSLSDPTRAYQLAQGVCQCRDWGQAPEHLCCHRLAAGFLRRAEALLAVPTTTCAPAESTAVENGAPSAPVPEAPRERSGMRLEASVIIAGRPVKVAVWGPDDADVQARLAAVLAQYPPAIAAAQAQDTTPQCPMHGAKKPSTKGKGYYCPHKLSDGSWCKA